MGEAYIVEALRTPGGRRKGKLSQWHPADLGAAVINELVKRVGIPGECVDDVIWGCVGQNGAQAGNIARNVVLSSELPESVPGVSVDRQCGSSQQAIHFAAQAVMSGTQDVVIAGGVEVMSLVTMGSNVSDSLKEGHGHPYKSKGIEKRYPGVEFSQFMGAELIAKQWRFSREQLDDFAFTSHQKAASASQAGYFNKEILPIIGHLENGDETLVTTDEGIRFNASREALSGLKILMEGGRITAGNASQITDGSAALMLMSETGLKRFGVTPRARIHALALAGDDPVKMLTGPIPATQKILERVDMSIDDMAVYEVNEAFAPVPLAWLHETGADPERLNVNGGAIALGHPLGGTGAKLMTTLLHELERRKARFGLQAICEGGGTANATIIERLS